MGDIGELLKDGKFNFITDENKEFIAGFDKEMEGLGYGCGNKIGEGFCWGRYMIIYTKTGVKSKKVYARIYIREKSIALRMFFGKMDDHREYLEETPEYIKNVFTGEYGDCKHCHNEKNGSCKFRKTYTLENRLIEKCNGSTFLFEEPDINRIPELIGLFCEFYPKKNR